MEFKTCENFGQFPEILTVLEHLVRGWLVFMDDWSRDNWSRDVWSV